MTHEEVVNKDVIPAGYGILPDEYEGDYPDTDSEWTAEIDNCVTC